MERKFKVTRVKEGIGGFARAFRLSEDERLELEALTDRLVEDMPQFFDRSRNLDLLAAAIVWSYLRWVGYQGYGGITLESVAEHFGVKEGSVSQKAASIQPLLDEDDEEFLRLLLEEFSNEELPVGGEVGSEFVDRDHYRAQEAYWGLMESEAAEDEQKVEKMLEKIIETDPDFYDPYVTLFELYRSRGERAKMKKIVTKGYRRALGCLNVKEKEPLPSIPWGFIENRHLVRMLYAYGQFLWEAGQKEEALDLFERILRSNPWDNIGARYAMAAILDGYEDQEAFEEPFLSPEGYGLDAMAVDKWFDKVARRHPERFAWWFEAVDEE